MATPILTTKLHIPSPPQALVPRERLISRLDRGAPGKLIRGSFEMFGSILGTWLPFALIFTASYLTGRLCALNARIEPARIADNASSLNQTAFGLWGPKSSWQEKTKGGLLQIQN